MPERAHNCRWHRIREGTISSFAFAYPILLKDVAKLVNSDKIRRIMRNFVASFEKY
jgi:hypothetical protein